MCSVGVHPGTGMGNIDLCWLDFDMWVFLSKVEADECELAVELRSTIRSMNLWFISCRLLWETSLHASFCYSSGFWCAIKLNAFLPLLKTCSACFNDVKQWHRTTGRAIKSEGECDNVSQDIQYQQMHSKTNMSATKELSCLISSGISCIKTTQKQTQRNVGYISFERFVPSPVSSPSCVLLRLHTAVNADSPVTMNRIRFSPRLLWRNASVMYANEISRSLSQHLPIFSALPSNVMTWIIKKLNDL